LTSGSGTWDSGWVKKSGSGSGMNNPDHISESLKKLFWGVKILKFFDVDPGPGIEQIWIRDPRRKKVGSGINIPAPQHWCYREKLLE
jgi:hypothetical protein